jgi:hypothetical protein
MDVGKEFPLISSQWPGEGKNLLVRRRVLHFASRRQSRRLPLGLLFVKLFSKLHVALANMLSLN